MTLTNPTFEPTISIVIPCYNYGSYIVNTMRSVLDQTYHHVELIVVDNGSSDDSLEKIQSVDDPRLKVLKIEENRGPVPAWHLGFEHCTGDFFALLSADDFWHEDKLQKQVEYLRENRDITMLGTFVQQVDGDGEPVVGDAWMEEWVNREFDFSDHELWEWEHRLCIPSAIYSKELCDRAGPPSVGLNSICDWDFHIRLLRQGGRAAVIPDRLTFYRWHGNNQSLKGRSRFVIEWIYSFITQHIPLLQQKRDPEASVRTVGKLFSKLPIWEYEKAERQAFFLAALYPEDVIAVCSSFELFERFVTEPSKMIGGYRLHVAESLEVHMREGGELSERRQERAERLAEEKNRKSDQIERLKEKLEKKEKELLDYRERGLRGTLHSFMNKKR